MSVVPCAPGAPTAGAGGSAAHRLVASYESSVAPAARRTGGVHYTPPALARFLVETAITALGHLPRTICDPTCGAGAFLLAAADALADRGVDPVEVVERRLVGGELDPGAAAVARAALERWAHDRVGRDTTLDVVGLRPRVEVGDRLLVAPTAWAGRPSEGFDLVVGNPPFLNQLASTTARGAGARHAVRERFGAVGAYADTASLFLLGSLDLVAPGGAVAMLQPQSFLAARDTAGVRALVLERAALCDIWSSDEQPFEASVHVCAPVLRRRAASAAPTPANDPEVRVHWGAVTSAGERSPVAAAPSAPSVERRPPPQGEDSWGPLFATALGLPGVRRHGGPRLGTAARATAGFRDEFYALLDASVDVGDLTAVGAGDAADDGPRLLTVGMIDPGRSTWGERARRFGGRSQLAPRLDEARLRDHSPRVAAWAAARRVPKVLVATQTKVVEAVADPLGEWVPVTPTISVEPHDDPSRAPAETVWRLTAALLAPPVAATALATHLGAGWSPGALRWSARAVLEVELPCDEACWAEGAVLARELAVSPPGERAAQLDRLGRVMCRAHGLDGDDEVHGWWLERAVRASS